MDICKEAHDRKGNLKVIIQMGEWNLGLKKTQEEKVQVEMTGLLHCFLKTAEE